MWSTKSSANPDPTEYPKHLNASGMIGHDRIDFTYGGKNFTVPDACFRPGMVLNWTTDALGSMPSCYVCKLGHYCPTIGGNLSTQLPCPRNYYCAGRGWAEPEKCGHTYDFTRAWAREQCRSTATLRKGLGNATPPTYIEGSLRVFCLVFGTFLLNMLIKVYKVLYIKYFSGKTIARALARTKLKMKGKLRRLSSSSGPNKKSYATFPVRPGITFTYNDLSLTVPLSSGKSKMIVDKVSGEVPAATMTAVMGPSGAGKTSFMNVLCDRAGYGVTTGQLTLNGKEDRISNHRDIMGFVPQDDVVHDDLTVRENLTYAAMLRLPLPEGSGCRTKTMFCSKANVKYYDQYVDRVLEMLQMGHIQHSIVGSVEKRGISGGQKKRVNIGLELVSGGGGVVVGLLK